MALNLDGAREAADASTARYREGRPLGPVDGMPIGIKDILQTHDMPTGLGIAGNEGARTRQDSSSVWALRAAGAVILGKTVTTELGGAHPSKSRNPFDARRSAGGSSSGSGAAVGACMVPAALGTQVVGSIIRPAAYSANAAIKPTFGALSGTRYTAATTKYATSSAGSQSLASGGSRNALSRLNGMNCVMTARFADFRPHGKPTRR